MLPRVPAKAGTQLLALDSRLRGNERIHCQAATPVPIGQLTPVPPRPQ
jgi:hypothetical protein